MVAVQVGGEPRPPVDRSVEDDGARLCDSSIAAGNRKIRLTKMIITFFFLTVEKKKRKGRCVCLFVCTSH